jgi:endothelin-converting enzyme/putative endopeptidase
MRKAALLIFIAAACKSSPETKPPAATPPPGEAMQTAAAPHPAPAPGIDLDILDRSVSPCDDFYRFACGKWIDRTPVPADRSRWTRSFDEIFDRNEYTLRAILEKGVAADADPYAVKTKAYYDTCMNEQKAETASFATLQAMLSRIDSATPAQLPALVADAHRGGVRAFFFFTSRQDFKDATQVIGSANQGGLGLPNKTYYFRTDPKSQALRDDYVVHISKMLQLAGEKPEAAAAHAKQVMELETAMAKASLDPIELRDPKNTYHRLERKGLMEAAPHFDWTAYFTEVGVPEVQAINVNAPDFFKALDGLIASQPPEVLKAYLRWHTIEGAADTLGKGFVEERFRFNQALTGAKEILPRWKRCVEMTDRALGEALGRSFAAATGGEQGKPIAKEMIVSIEDAFERNLSTLTWMDEEGKKASKYKLDKIFNKVAYPDNWRDYSTMQIGTESLLANQMEAARFESHRQLSKIGKPLNRAEWGMTPPTVNAYYNASLNEMVFPLGIMQLPFFSPNAPLDANYGGIGMVMGHELTHGFDDQGRKFDGDGSYHEWWTGHTTKEFEERAACVVKQYDSYIAVDDVHLQGKLTLGENLGDIGGLKLTLSALRKRRQGMPPTNVGGFDDDQQAFIAFAQNWCTSTRPEQLRTQALTNPHSTSQWRVNGPVTDNPDFAKAFSCPANAPLNPPQRCQVW